MPHNHQSTIKIDIDMEGIGAIEAMASTMKIEGTVAAILSQGTEGAGAASLIKRPTLPANFFKFPVRARLKAVQQFISSFEYKQSPQTSFNAHKARPLARIMDTAKMMIYNPQPIKCVEAVFLALYLTAGIPDVERIPLGFKSELQGQVHQHIVLLVRHNGKFGAFGISRHHDLMNKELEFESMSNIVDNYKKAYEQSLHKVLRIRVGLPVEHNIESFNFVCWRYLSLDPSSSPWEHCCNALERHAIQAKRLWDRWLLEGQRESKKGDLCLKNAGTLTNLTVANSKKKILEPMGQESSLKLIGTRQVLKEIQTSFLKNSSSRGMACKQVLTYAEKNSKKSQLSFVKRSPRELPLSGRRCLRCRNLGDGPHANKTSGIFHNRVCKRMAFKCYSFELLSNSGRKLALHLDKGRQKLLTYHSNKGCQNLIDKGRKQTQVDVPLKVLSTAKPLCKR